MQRRLSAALLLVIVLSACSTRPSAATPQPTASPSAADPLAGTSWELASIDGAAPLPGAVIWLEFHDGVAEGFAGCNHLSGPYHVGRATLRLSEVAQTAMACEDAALMRQERLFTEALWATESYTLQEGAALELRDAAGAPRLVFRARERQAADSAAPRDSRRQLASPRRPERVALGGWGDRRLQPSCHADAAHAPCRPGCAASLCR